MADRKNVLLIVSDQERNRSWIPPELHERLPARSRLVAEGMDFTNHHTHSSPCSPSRATLFSGQYVPEHGVTDNVFVDPAQPDLHTGTPTLGHLLGAAGYYCGYVGKWHLSYGNPDMPAYGFSDWSGSDWAWTGLAGTGTYFDPLIADQATAWLADHAASDDPWFLAVGLVNPHDIHWYPGDQPWWQERHPEHVAMVNETIVPPIPGESAMPAFGEDYDELFPLPDNFADDLNAKPAVHKQWRYEENHGWWGGVPYDQEWGWRRARDYYFKLHQLSDGHVGRILDALDASGRADDTVVVFTSDHGDMCGSHGLWNKGPFAYEEIMHIPLHVRAPGITTPGATTAALSSSADVPATICALAGVDDTSSISGVDLSPVMADPSASVRDHVLYAQAQGWYKSCVATRFALRGYFDGRYKYVRYFGVGGGVDSQGQGLSWAPTMQVGPDAAFWDQDHELYDTVEDPGELVNLAADRSRRADVQAHFDRLLELERAAFTHERPSGKGVGSTHSAMMLDQSTAFADG